MRLGRLISLALMKARGATALVRAGTAPVFVGVMFVSAHVYPAMAQDSAVAKIGVVEAATEGSEREFYGRVVALETLDLAFQVGG
ncbi:MAG: hypothetical protein AAFN63_08935 [Pseudomonadota bacterium]